MKYVHSTKVHNTNSAEIIVPVLIDMISPTSVLDVGCGIGTWLKVFEHYGIDDILGLDGSYIDYSKLLIECKRFKEVDLQKEFSLNRKYDLALCLEVAEHLPESSADILVESLCNHSNVIIFSAAIPNQGGQNHVNEQWPIYWQSKFEKFGFYFHDVLRSLVWNDEKVDWWYKQNIFLINKEKAKNPVMGIVHPLLFKQKIENLQRNLNLYESGKIGTKASFKLLLKACTSFLKLK